jgi:hypothetical protein
LNQPRKTPLKNYPLRPGGARFAIKATLKALALLCGILVAVNGIREELKSRNEMQALQGQALTPKQAAKVLQVSTTKLQGLKEDALVEGVHYWQDEGILRYSPEIGRLFIEKSMKRPEKNKASSTTKKTKAKQADKLQTRNAFKEKK